MKTVNSHVFELENLKKYKPILGFDENESFEHWKNNARKKLMELLGLPLKNCDAEFEIEYQKSYDEYREYRFKVQTEPGYCVPCHLLIPIGALLPLPLTVCLSGHGSGMHIALGRPKSESDAEKLQSWHHRATALRSIKEGRCALVIEARNFGESSIEGYGNSCTEAAKIAILMGRTVIGERVWDAMRILDAVADNFAEVDMTDIVCTGNSGGGTATYYLACLDERITSVAPSCAVCSYSESIAAMPHCMCNHIPGIRKYFEMGDLAGLIVPRKLVIAAGIKDEIFPIHGTRREFDKIKLIYQKAGVSENCALLIGDGGHLNYADLIWERLHQMGV